MSILEIDTSELNSENPEFIEVPGRINTPYHDGPISIDAKQEKLIITRIDNKLGGKKFENKMKLFEGKYVDGKWKNFKALPFNSDEYSVGYACYADTSGNSIIFASDMPGGYGGMDLYASQRVDGVWESPKNLGPVINTSLSEVFPFVLDKQLYFSSNGQVGYGGLDIFVSEFDKNWQQPANVKGPINSSRDEFGITFLTDSTGFYASNRAGGRGKDDIYRFRRSATLQTVGISGVFEYNGLPVDSVKVLLVNDEDSVLAIAYTDKDGVFNFKNLAYQDDYLVRVETEDSELVQDGKLYLTNDKGDKIKLIERLKDGKFKFKALPAEEFVPELLAENDIDSLPEDAYIRGNLYKKLPGDFEDTLKVYLVDDAGTIVDSTFSDHEGNFEFSKLSLDDNSKYFVQLEAVDKVMSIAFINQKERIYKVVEGDSATFELANELDPSEKPTITASQGLTGIIARLEVNGKPLPYTRVQIYDVNNILIGTVITNENGEFQYNKLEVDDKYLFKLPDVADAELQDAFLYVTDVHGDPLYLIHKLQDNSFEFRALPFERYTDVQLLEEAAVPDLIDFEGVVFRKLAGDMNKPMKVYLLDDEGNIIDSVLTDANGEFNFEKLSSDQNYFFKLEDPEDLNLALYDVEKRIVEEAILNEKGNFEYKKLTYMVAQFSEEEAIDPTVVADKIDLHFYGQVFKKLPGDYEQGMKVLIYDEDGNYVGSAYTNKDGRFKYKKLKIDETYVFKLEGEEDYQIVNLDQEGNVLSRVLRNEKGEFEYKTLSLDEYKTTLIAAEDLLAVSYEEIDIEVYGQVFRKLPGDYKEGMKVLIYDEDGNYIGSAYTDKDGKFKYNKLKVDETYVFKVDGEDGDHQIITLDSEGNVLSKVIRNEHGEFEYSTLPLENYKTALIAAEDNSSPGYSNFLKKQKKQKKKEARTEKPDVSSGKAKGTYTVYYRFDSTNVNAASKKVMRQLLKDVRNSESKIEVNSHTDNRGPKVYNEYLSKRRTNSVIDYLVRNGVAKDRIIGNYFGELKPVVDCLKIKCNNDDHAKNRRTEIRVIAGP